jgi:hypothetical protein
MGWFDELIADGSMKATQELQEEGRLPREPRARRGMKRRRTLCFGPVAPVYG